MDGLMLLDRAREAGLRFRAEGDRLVIRGPKKAASLAMELLSRKDEVLRLLLQAEEDFQWLLGMSLADFSRQQLEVRVYSEILRETVVLVSNDDLAEQTLQNGEVPYTPSEIRRLWAVGANPEDLRAIHAVKKKFCGTVL
jgi:hypothetical protein